MDGTENIVYNMLKVLKFGRIWIERPVTPKVFLWIFFWILFLKSTKICRNLNMAVGISLT